jgi:hypothetical protein
MGCLRSQKSLTLIEMMIATGILAYALCGILAMYISCFDLIATSKNIGIATTAAQGLLEEIRSASFDQIYDDYDTYDNGIVITVDNMPTNRVAVKVDDSDPELLRITISVCWRQKNRLIGEDSNLNGTLDAGEDDGDNIIDSPVQLITLLANR